MSEITDVDEIPVEFALREMAIGLNKDDLAPAFGDLCTEAADEITKLRADLATRTAERDEALKALEHILAMPRIKLHGNHFGEWSERATIIKAANIVLAKHQPKGDSK